jgi:DNA repair exonuclease SbcCD ATPase subunit
MDTNFTPSEPVSVALALTQGNECPVCGRQHRTLSAVVQKHAATLAEWGYLGYDYDYEKWVQVYS